MADIADLPSIWYKLEDVIDPFEGMIVVVYPLAVPFEPKAH
jgi:hypothetical protein